jgi:23S rRNA pseudouridine2605 synthase
VNGSVAQVGQTVDPDRDVILVDGNRIGAPAPTEWFVLNKPAGVITSRHDPEGRRTVFDLVPARPGLTYVGRLDYLTEGVLLLTTDGSAAHRLTHPSHEVERTYVASVLGEGDLAVEEARYGVQLEDGLVKPKRMRAEKRGRGRWDLTITLSEGRNREVRRLCEALGLQVDRLVRVQFGPVELGDLATGRVRSLTRRERVELEKL